MWCYFERTSLQPGFESSAACFREHFILLMPSPLCHFMSHLFISSFTRLEACLCLPAWFCNTTVFVCFISLSLTIHPPPSPHSSIFHLYLSSSFSAQFLCVIFYLPPALLPELVTNVPVRRLVKHLYSTLGCVITFNPVPFLFCSLSAEEEAVLRRFHRQCKERHGV